MEKPMPDPGRDAEDRRAVARQSWLEHPSMNTLAIAVSTTEAKASFLPGRVNGPADAYRHIVWVGEMTRRLGPNMAGSLSDLHETQGQASALRRDMMGQGRDPINDAAATAMDRRNNLIGVSIGQRARTFDDVLSMARETIERSPVDGSGGVIGAVWLPRRDWLANPPSDESQWNWPRPDWSRVPTRHVTEYRMGGEAYRRGANHRLLAAERRAALDAEKRAEWALMLQEDEASDELVHVRAHARDGHPVRAYTRSAP
jgi:hypothetical protein